VPHSPALPSTVSTRQGASRSTDSATLPIKLGHCTVFAIDYDTLAAVEFTRKSLHNPCGGVLRVTSFGHQALIAAQVDASLVSSRVLEHRLSTAGTRAQRSSCWKLTPPKLTSGADQKTERSDPSWRQLGRRLAC
jgi:hypothetical protein